MTRPLAGAAVERHVRVLLRAWPAFDRAARGDEILATTLDLVPKGRRRLPLAVALSLGVGGLRARWRARPPIWRWWNYALSGELPARWHRWMLSDLLRPGWCRRMVARLVAGPAMLTMVGMVIVFPLPSPFGGTRHLASSVWHAIGFSFLALMEFSALGWAAGAALTRSQWARRRRGRFLALNGYDESGRPDPLARPRQRLEVARRKRRGANHPEALKAAADLGVGLVKAGRLDDAVSVLSDTFERARGVAPDDDWPTWQSGEYLAGALACDGRGEQATAVARQVLARVEHVHGPDHVRTLRCACTAGEVLLKVDRLDEAIDLLADTFGRGKRHAPDQCWPTWTAGYNLALALATAGRLDEAVSVARDVLSGSPRPQRAEHADTMLKVAATLGQELRLAGRLNEAIELLADTFERGKKDAAHDDWPTWWAGHELAAALDEVGRVDEAVRVRSEVEAARSWLKRADDSTPSEV